MGGILGKLDEWLRGLLIEGITGNLSGMFDTVNTKVGEIAGEVGLTPQAWNGGVFSMIRSLSETVILPIAGVILTFVMCYELIQLVTEKNNLHDVDTWMFFKWIFKTFCAVLIVTNTWNIVMGVFDVAQSVVNSSAGVIIGSTSVDINTRILCAPAIVLRWLRRKLRCAKRCAGWGTPAAVLRSWWIRKIICSGSLPTGIFAVPPKKIWMC